MSSVWAKGTLGIFTNRCRRVGHAGVEHVHALDAPDCTVDVTNPTIHSMIAI